MEIPQYFQLPHVYNCFFFEIAESKMKFCPNYEECGKRLDENENADVSDICPPEDDLDCIYDNVRYYAVVELNDKQYRDYLYNQELFEK